ncbi:MAG TPA: serine hydrolase [Pyrinomonadaceae bacterium]
MRPKAIVSLLLVCVVHVVSLGQSVGGVESRIGRVEKGLLTAVVIKGDPTWSIEERMRHYKAPAVSVAVFKDFKVEWARAYGLKDVGTKEAATAETLFQAGSISKSVAAMVALRKVQEGKLALDENINNRLTSWKLPDNEFTAKKKVTLANLLSHSAGTTVHGFPGYAVSEKLPTLPQVLDGAAPANTAAVRVDLEPGTRFRYSGGGTTIAQLAVMDVERKSYPQIAKETVLGPVQMTNSTYSQPLPDDWRPRAATGYKPDGSEVKGKIHVYPEMAAAGLWTTPTDLAKFAIEVQLSLAGKSNKVLSKESVERMVTPFASENVGMGFFIQKHGAATYFGHGGADEGFRAMLLAHRERGYGAVVMVNSDNGQIMEEIVRSIAREYAWEDYLSAPFEVTTLAPERLDAYVGRFRINPDRLLNVTKEGGRLYAQPTQGPKVELLPISEDTFIRRDQNVQYTFVRNAEGRAGAIRVKSDGGANEAARVGDDVLIPYDLLMSGKTAEALAGYRQIRKEQPANVAVREERLNLLGYELMRQKKLAEAIAVFKLNVEFYPQSFNTYDSLGEAYMENGERELAIASYKKSLELNPKNDNGVQMLKKLEGK